MKTFSLARDYKRSLRLIAVCFIFGLYLLICTGSTSPIGAQELIPDDSIIKIFVQFGGIKGKTVTPNYETWSTALAVGSGLALESATTGGGTAGRCLFDGLNIVKAISIDSPELAYVCSNGSILPEVKVAVVRLNSKGSPKRILYEIKLTYAQILSISSGSQSTGNSLHETIKMTGQKVTWTVWDDRDTAITRCWDFTRNLSCP